ncbi:uncharacterized protein [Spinacia oleracea]|uniref:RNase H type-1 domain-containing protein n=1 Tax=Spinacia oleracea TaxID=3562 RepID=A0A9R0ISD7_SPIOL|nr:uncharacterized protein LOC110793556 [Spinacia oleracea]
MPGVDREIAEHHIPLYLKSKPKQQKLRRMKPEMSLKVKEEIQKQLDANFIKPIKHTGWLANVVVVPKKDGRVRVCIDFRDLNSSSPKDYFPLPHIDVLVDRYNQILMSANDMPKTSFITPWGTFCYREMPFGLKNAGATYQRAATTILHDLIHNTVEVYVDDMIVKSHDRGNHVEALNSFFDRIRKYNLRLNPHKCMFGVTSGKLLGFVVSQDGIKVDSGKSVKGRAISEALDDGPISGDEFKDDFPDDNIFTINVSKWKMYFDGASNRKGNGAGVLLIDPHGIHIPFAVKLSFPTTNNTAEYEACIYGIKAALAAGAKHLTMYGDSNLIISQTIGAWRVRDERLQMYSDYVQQFIPYFDNIDFKHLPREKNNFTDALANLAVNLTWEENVKIQSVTIVENESPVIEFENMIVSLIQEDEGDPWYIDIKKFLIDGQ